MQKVLFFLKKLEIQVVLALILAIIFGVYFPHGIGHITWMGDFFMKLLKVMLGPLLFLSVIVAILGLGDFKKLGGIGARTFGYYALTTTLAIGGTLVLMNIFKPGVGQSFGLEESFSTDQVNGLSFGSFIEGLIPSNIINAFVEFNAMQIVSMGIILGIAILATKNKVQIDIVEKVFKGINDGILKFIEAVIKLTPLGVFAIVANVVKENGVEAMYNLLPFVLVILAALFIHALITLPILGYIIGRFNPFKYLYKVKQAILVGFSTASSSATMGLSMSVAKNKANLNEDVVNFTFPIGTTVNMDGTALYQAGVAIFVAQILGVDLSVLQQLTVVIIVILASVGAAGIPGAGILILTTVFISIGLPVEMIGIILAVDRILDMFRTGVNVWGDLLTAKVVDTYYEKELKSLLEKVKS